MKISNMFLVVFFALVVSIRAEAGVIPYSLIQKEAEGIKTEKSKTCKDLEKRQSGILKKISDLRNKEEGYLKELDRMGGNYCPEGRS